MDEPDSANGGVPATVVIDGHTRLSVARELGLGVVPVSAVPYADLAAALKQAVHNQKGRRNATGAQLIHVIEVVDRVLRQPKGGNNLNGSNQYARGVEASRDASTPTPNKSAAETATIVGTSRSMVERARQIYDDEEAKKEVESGASIYTAAKGGVPFTNGRDHLSQHDSAGDLEQNVTETPKNSVNTTNQHERLEQNVPETMMHMHRPMTETAATTHPLRVVMMQMHHPNRSPRIALALPIPSRTRSFGWMTPPNPPPPSVSIGRFFIFLITSV